MRKFIDIGIIVTLAILFLASIADAQRTSRLTRPCPGTTTPAKVEIETDGDVAITPCAGRVINSGSGVTVKAYDPAYVPLFGASTTTRFTVGSTTAQVIPTNNFFSGVEFYAKPQLSGTSSIAAGLVNFLVPAGAPSNPVTFYGAFNSVGEGGGFSGTYGEVIGTASLVGANTGTMTASPWTGVYGSSRSTGFALSAGGTTGTGIAIFRGVHGLGGHGYSIHAAEVTGVRAETAAVNATALGSASTQRLMGLQVVHRSVNGDPSFNIVTDRYGIYIGNYATAHYSVLNNYGIYIDATVDELGSTSKSAIYSLSVAPSFLSGKLSFDATYTAGGTTGNQTINKPAFSVNFAAAASSLTVTNSFVAASSVLLCTVQTADGTLKSVSAVAGSGSVVLTGNAAATGETKVYCEVRN